MSGTETSTAGGGPVLALKRARRATDLWTSIETAEYAYVILGDAAASDADATVVGAFRAAFAATAERWTGAATENKAPLLGALQTAIDGLGGEGFGVYWACVVCSLSRPDNAALSLPLALLHVDAIDADEIEITLRQPLLADMPVGAFDDDN